MAKKYRRLVEIDPNKPTNTDWARVDAMTEEEIERAAASDPDNPLWTDEEFANAQWIMPPTANKQMITIRIDSDVLNFFKGSGQGYQKRINAVLRAYFQSHAARKAG